MKAKETKEKALCEDVLTDDIMRITADMIQAEIDMDILAHEKKDIDIPTDFDERMLAAARKVDSERRRKQRALKRNRVFRFAAIFLVCIISVGSITMVSSEAFRKKVIQIFFNQDKGAVTLRSSEEEELIGDWENFWYPEMLPEGFNLITAEESDHFLLYSNLETGQEMYLYEQDIESMVSIDSDTTNGELIQIGYSEGYLFKLEDMNVYGVLWRTEDRAMTMYFEGEWEETTILEIAENMVYVDKF